MSDEKLHVLPECTVTFKGIGRDLQEIKETLNRLVWWMLGVMTALTGGAIVFAVTMVVNK